ncbi:MAG: nitroreductase family protein [Candidatus Scalinduaceae bacterium]
MNILRIIKERRSVRKFLNNSIPKEIQDALKEAIIWAPSAGNLQSRKFYFVFNRAIKKDLAKAALSQSFIAEAPLVIIACMDIRIKDYYGERGVSLYAIQDVAASIQNVLLVAHEQGLASVWIGAFHEDEVHKILKLPKFLRPISIIPVGYTNVYSTAPGRISVKDAVDIIE